MGETVEESYVVKKLLRSVTPKFLQITSTIEQFGDLEVMSVEEAVGSLKAHDERLKGQNESHQGGQLLLTEDEWVKRENSENKLLLTREEWIKKSEGSKSRPGNDYRGKSGGRGVRDKSRVKCWNCFGYGHFAVECKKPKREREQNTEANLTQIQDEESALLIAECEKEGKLMMLNEEKVSPKLKVSGKDEKTESNV